MGSDYGLAALMGLLRGSEGFPEGLIAGDKQRLAEKTQQESNALAQQQLEESKRHTAVMEGQLNTPIASIKKMLGMPTTAEDESNVIPTSLAGHGFSALEKERAAADEKTRRAALGAELTKIQAEQTPQPLPDEAAMYAPTEANPGKKLTGEEKLARLLPLAGKDEMTVLRDFISPHKSVAIKQGETLVNPDTGEVIFQGDAKPANEAAYERIARKSVEGEYQRYLRGEKADVFPYPPDSPEFNIEVRKRTEKILMAPQGSEGYRQSELGSGRPDMRNEAGAPARPQPVIRGETPPVPEPITQDIRGLAAVKQAVKDVKSALELHPDTVDSYIGPYAQYGSTVQGKVPYAAAGNH